MVTVRADPAKGADTVGRIIVADDDELVGKIVSNTLMSAGHAVGWLPDGASALSVIRNRPPDLVILDCNMPGMSGIHVLQQLRKDEKLYEVPVLMLTARTGRQDENIARFSGATDYLRKPFLPLDLLGRVNSLVAGNRWTL